MKRWRQRLSAAALGIGSGLGGLVLASCRGQCDSCCGCLGGGLLGLVALAGAWKRRAFRPKEAS